ncbi:MAG: class I SAM-dependent DNA methyltransferase [Cyanophyceae cyanobacterium]
MQASPLFIIDRHRPRQLTKEMLQYYEQRRPEYEAIYSKPERQNDLDWLEQQICSFVPGRRVLEIASGTGYWTRRISKTASFVLATDASEQLAAIAVESCPTHNVQSQDMDAFSIPKDLNFDCLIAGFFFSHVLLNQQRQFLNGIAQSMKPGSKLILFDNRFVEGSSTPISRVTEAGDTYQQQRLSDGSCFEVLKNFPRSENLTSLFHQFCRNVSVKESQYFWLASGNLVA